MFVSSKENGSSPEDYVVAMSLIMTYEEAVALDDYLRDYNPVGSEGERMKNEIVKELHASVEMIRYYNRLP